MLRRSRYEALRGDRPWERKGLTADRPLVAPWAGNRHAAAAAFRHAGTQAGGTRRAGRPQGRIGALGVAPHVPGKSGSQSIVLRRQGDRLEIRLPGCVLRAEGDAAAIAWPGLRLVELGNWGEEVRRLADRRLPWLPHRTNDELARLFHVTKTDAGRVRLVPAGLPEDANTWLEAEFAGPSELPPALAVAIGRQAHRPVAARRQNSGHGRRRRQGPRPVGTDPVGNRRRRGAAAGGRLAGLRPAGSAVGRARGRSECRRSRRGDGPVRVAQGGRPSWRGAEDPARGNLCCCCSRLGVTSKIRGWAAGSRRSPCSKTWPGRGSGRSAREVNEGNFPSLSPAQHYAILSALPAKALTAADQDRLAALAAEAGRLDEALAHAQAALSRDKGGRRFERHRAVVELLLKLERAGEAEETARRWAADGRSDAGAIGRDGRIARSARSPDGRRGVVRRRLGGQGPRARAAVRAAVPSRRRREGAAAMGSPARGGPRSCRPSRPVAASAWT